MSFDKQKDLKMTQQTVSFLMLTFIFAFFSFSLPHFVSSAKLLYNGTADVELKTLVQTKSGPIVGLITTRNGVNVSCYLGIPYAEAPIGNLRFSEPIAVKSWKKTYPAVRQPPICYQREWSRFRPTDFEVVRELMKEDAAVHDFYLTHKDEDCLYLSVYTQTVPNRKRVAANKTTLVWIHGGAFISGAANLPFHTFAFMVASDPNLIVVSVNYRLNVFGFLTTGTKSMPGNLGLKDQILALRFVKANIGAFGGDPKKVVLWGQSAGAVSIGYHMMSRKSGDLLFKRAILESGNPLLPLTLASPSYRQNAFLDFINKFNCSTESDDHPGDSAKWIDQNWAKKLLPCLQSLSASQLFSEYQKFALHTPLAFLPNVQDRSLFSFSSFWKGVRSGSYTFSGDILSGTNEAEGAQYVKIGPLESFYSRNEISANFTRSNVLAKLTSFVPENLRSMVEPVVDVLADGVEDPNNSTQMWQRYVQLVGDMVFVCPDFYFLKGYLDRQASNRRKSHLASVYYYRFRPLVSHPVDCPRWSLGACHTDELQFFFGKPLLLPSLYPPEERQLSRSMLTTLLDFAHGSSLSSERSNVSFFHWRPFTKDNPEYLQIDLTEAKMVKGFPGQRCEELCEPLYELLESMDDSQMKLIKTKIV